VPIYIVDIDQTDDEDVEPSIAPVFESKELERERERAERLAAQLRLAHAEIAALELARDTAIRLAVWGGSRRVDVDTRGEH
jgi:hypothetical protein